ncbi:hypothetical protein FOZ63_012963, partial [Perkinsus olseni]
MAAGLLYDPTWIGYQYELSVCVFGFISFIVALFVIPLVRHRKTMVFLDKCCIPQKDPVAKSYGISRLADYLHASDKLLILWSPDYLDRLWCVYELAVFLQTHDEDDVVLLNLDHLKLCVSLMFLQFLSIVVAILTEAYYVDVGYILYVFLLASGLLTDYEAYRCSEEWQKFCSEVKSFTLRKAKCSSLADYPILKQLIVDMYGSETRFEAAVRALWLGRMSMNSSVDKQSEAFGRESVILDRGRDSNVIGRTFKVISIDAEQMATSQWRKAVKAVDNLGKGA